VELIRRGFIASNPIDFVSVAVEEEEERSSGDGILPEDGFAGEVASKRPVENEFIGEKRGVFRILVVLLTQQYAAPSAARGEEVEEEELSLGFGLGQGLVERAREPSDLGRENRGREKEKEKEGDDRRFFHAFLLEAEFLSMKLR
jgi:hypothetical protein